ncbi:hypothetical protein PPYR_09493 [Photinus pyralis]|uniref:Uncharacterized protein n=1 Tax=Photinus pyralis TaxID=7054 RepID=A0A5N4AMD5_PHOPY|nr:hypothetical protein PPYR_09493 [Photinus pyralis]
MHILSPQFVSFLEENVLIPASFSVLFKTVGVWKTERGNQLTLLVELHQGEIREKCQFCILLVLSKDGKKMTEADRNVLRRLVMTSVMTYKAGWSVDITSILKHKLFPVPLSLAEMDGALRSSEKASLLKISNKVENASSIDTQ